MGFCVGLCFGMHNFMSFPVLHLVKEKKAGCFAFVVFQMSCYYKWSAAPPRGAVGWSAVYDCVIS